MMAKGRNGRFSLAPGEGKDVAAKIAAANSKIEEEERDRALASLEKALEDTWSKLTPEERRKIAKRYFGEAE